LFIKIKAGLLITAKGGGAAHRAASSERKSSIDLELELRNNLQCTSTCGAGKKYKHITMLKIV